jgi:hypothetical protein
LVMGKTPGEMVAAFYRQSPFPATPMNRPGEETPATP